MLSASTVIAHASNTRDAVAMWLSVRLRSVPVVRNQLPAPAAKVSDHFFFSDLTFAMPGFWWSPHRIAGRPGVLNEGCFLHPSIWHILRFLFLTSTMPVITLWSPQRIAGKPGLLKQGEILPIVVHFFIQKSTSKIQTVGPPYRLAATSRDKKSQGCIATSLGP